MSDVAIQAEGLSKLYHIGPRERYYTLRDTLMNTLKAPFRPFCRNGSQNSPIEDRDNTIWALKNVSFEIKKGDVVGVIGRNGAGKSTLLKILSRITEPTEGEARIYGRVGSLLEVGTGFHSELTGRENIYLNGAILGMKKAEISRRFDEIVSFAEVEKFLDTPVKHYSSGMYVRLAFAVAAHLNPEILLVDEVLAVGDAAFQKKCLGKMSNVAREGRTVLFVSHNMQAVRTLCESCVLLNSGQAIFMGEVDTCIEQYLHCLQENGGIDSKEIETLSIPRPEGLGTPFRISRVRLQTAGPGAALRFGESIGLEMEIECYEEQVEVGFGVAIHLMDGVRILQCLNTEASPPIPLLEPGKYCVRFVLPHNPIAPGHYRLDFGARCAKKGLDWVRGVLPFEILPTDRYDSTWFAPTSGYFRLPSVWTVNKLPDGED